jgi:hypothetical protein
MRTRSAIEDVAGKRLCFVSCQHRRPAAGIPYFTCARARKNLRSAARARLILQVISVNFLHASRARGARARV